MTLPLHGRGRSVRRAARAPGSRSWLRIPGCWW
jgi:hypothetical protein